ncbi:methyltransferase regulatory domain-containing protein [Ignatzschineria sp. LJL83]
MSNWSDGYISDIGYTYGYYSGLNPNNLLLPLLVKNMALPNIKTACELGFGQGVSINAHAAANSEIEWWGTDFNPSHASFAKELAHQSQEDIHLFDQTFEEFCHREDLPDFDFICLHGIWSWISDENRKVLVNFIRNKLKIGGILYVSYNTLPGWSAKMPVRHMLAEHAHIMGSKGQGTVNKVNDAVSFTKELIHLSENLTRKNASIAEQVERIAGQDPHYLAHEYFNRDWDPMYFSDMGSYLESAKISYVCSSNFVQDFAPGLFSPEQREFWQGIKDPMFAQLVKDYLLNTQFRTDIWMKGPRELPQLQIEKLWQQLRFVAITELPEKLDIASYRSVTLLPGIYEPIANLLSDHHIHTFSEIEAVLPNENLENIGQALAILHAMEKIVVVQEEQIIDSSRKSCQLLNKYIIEHSLTGMEISYLVSPVSGGAVQVGRLDRLMILAYLDGCHETADIVPFVWKVLQKNNQLLMHDGETLKTEAENLEKLETLVNEFLLKTLPIYQLLQLI